MKLLKFIELSCEGPSCQHCVYFQNDPAYMEKIYPGLSILSSGYASVRHRDGVCDLHQIYLSASDVCPAYVPQQKNGFEVEKDR